LEPVVHQYDWKSTALYALALGYGSDPLDEAQLRFVYEKELRPVPSLCNTLAHPGFWIKDPALGLDWVRALHAEQSFEINKALPCSGRLEGRYAITGVADKGAEKGAILEIEKQLFDKSTDTLHATVRSAIFLRGDGGQGEFGSLAPSPDPLPQSAPDRVIDIETLPQTALIYRLNGDLNPLHVDPRVAKAAGFASPILHGLATMGFATRAIMEAACGQDPDLLSAVHVRFTQPVYPGETIRTEIYLGRPEIRFRCVALERDVVVLDRGLARILDEPLPRSWR
jgi:acyl dehydratase